MNNRARDTIEHDFLDDPVPSDPAFRVSGVQARAERQPSLPPGAATERLPALISIGAPADSALLEPTYAYLSTYCARSFSPQVAERVNVAIYELYSNALRYGSSTAEVRLELTVDTSKTVTLSISNDADPESVARLQRQVARVRENASAAFDSEMERFAGASQPPPMLGIVRIAHESALAIELSVVGSRVEISIRCR